MKELLKKIGFKLSDLFLLSAAGIFIALITLRQDILYRSSPSSYVIPLWVSIVLLVFLVGFLSAYFYLEVYRSKEKPNLIIISAFLGLVLLNIIAISVQPLSNSVNTFFRMSYNVHEVGDPVSINFLINPDDKAFFVAEIIAILSFVYIAVFVFPKRQKSFKLTAFAINCLMVTILSMMIYSYITEWSHYVNFVRYFFGGHHELDLYTECTVRSYVAHRNGLAMFYLLGILFTIVLHGYTKRKYNYYVVVFLYINMIFTLCKASLILGTLAILIYFIYRMIVTFKGNKKRNVISISIVSSVVAIALILVGVAIISKGKYLGKIYSIYQAVFEDGRTVNTRLFIWDNVCTLISQGWWLIGRGHGILNLFLRPINAVTHQDYLAFQSHSAVVEILGEGGILFLLGYFALVGYTIYILIKSFKKDFDMSFRVALCLAVFLIYSLIENSQYVLYLLMFLTITVYRLNNKELHLKED